MNEYNTELDNAEQLDSAQSIEDLAEPEEQTPATPPETPPPAGAAPPPAEAPPPPADASGPAPAPAPQQSAQNAAPPPPPEVRSTHNQPRAGMPERTGSTTPTISGGYADLLDFIASGEGGYNSMNQGTQGGNTIIGSTHDASSILGKNLTDMTVGEIRQYQTLPETHPQRLFAAGRYQIIPGTMGMAMEASGVTDNDLFDSKTQDRLGMGLLLGNKRPNLAAYLNGRSNDLNAAMDDLAFEWASVPDPITGFSKYGNGNKALHSLEEVAAALQAARTSGSLYASAHSITPPVNEIPAATQGRFNAEESAASMGSLAAGGTQVATNVVDNTSSSFAGLDYISVLNDFASFKNLSNVIGRGNENTAAG